MSVIPASAHTIRHAEPRDIPRLSQLMSELCGHPISATEAAERLAMVQHSPIDQLFVFEQDDEVKGLLGFRLRENIEECSRYGEISVIVIDPLARRQGVGQALIAHAETLAEHYGCKGTWLVSGLAREEAHAFYQQLGYQINGYRFIKT